MKYSFICRSFEEEKAEISKIVLERKVFTRHAIVIIEKKLKENTDWFLKKIRKRKKQNKT
jgi:hypothetical protein